MKTLDEVYSDAKVDERTPALQRVRAIFKYLGTQGKVPRCDFLIRMPDGSLIPHSPTSEEEALRGAECLYNRISKESELSGAVA